LIFLNPCRSFTGKENVVMKTIWMVLTLAFMINTGHSQQVKDFFYADGKELPVFVRGELSEGIILLYVQGGGGETAIDFARADNPRWKHSLELEAAISYYDQRGLNVRLDKIDSSQISFEQYGDDIFKIAEELNRRYDAKIILIGHSLGGHFILHALSRLNDVPSSIKGAILLNTPITTDYSDERYRHYRPMYLKNLAYEFIQQNENVDYWKEALEWMNSTE
jgi:pimeloyl-ACP methyl ester carboxylesterase